MASGSPENHVDRLGHRLGDRSGNPTLAPEERIVTRRAGAIESHADMALVRSKLPPEKAKQTPKISEPFSGTA